MTIAAPVDLANAARFMAKHAKDHHAGAFATPTRAELAHYDVRDYDVDGRRTVIAARRLARPSTRTDFTGTPHELPAGAVVALVASEGGPLPPLDGIDYAQAYLEDRDTVVSLEAMGFRRRMVRVSAASELLGLWGLGSSEYAYPAFDRATAALIDDVPPVPLEAMQAEAAALAGWDDDFPFYSDGSWSALSLRGFWPEDPARGIKPSEMPKSWKAEHVPDLNRTPEWTTLADRTPELRAWVESVPWWNGLERVRLLRMAGRDGAGGTLGRHTDITDRAGGTRNGQIVRFHLPLITHPDITMSTWRLDGREHKAHLAEGQVYYLDARKPHAVHNPTGVNRIHLVCDVVADAGVRERLAAAQDVER